MKKIILTLAILMSFSSLFAQTPEKINYQAVARDLDGNPLTGETVNVQFDIIQASAVVYSETQTFTTNQFGLFNAAIGAGTVVSGDFSTIAWGNSATSLQVTINGDVMPATQLLSVPYALYAKQSLNGPTGAQGPAGAGIIWLGTLTTVPVTANLNDAYYNSTDGISYIYDGATWQILAQDGSASGDDWGADFVNTSGGNISGDGTISNPIIVIDNDTSKTNELQTLNFNSTNKNIIEISSGNGISLSPTIPVVNQVLTWDGSQWIAQNAGAGADDWGTQVVSTDTTLSGDGTSGDPLIGFNGQYSNLSGAPTTVSSFTNDVPYLTTFTEVDGSITNEIQTLTASGGSSPQIDLLSGGNVKILGSGGTTVSQTGNAITINSGVGTVTSVTGTAPIVSSGGATPSISLANTAVAPGAYGSATQISQFSVDAQGRLISASQVAITGTLPLGITGQTLYNNAGTWGSSSNLFHNGTNVGIGTASPSQKLDVNGKIRMRAGAGTAGYIPTSDANGIMTWTDPATISTANFWARGTGTLYPATITDNVGIGTANPQTNLHISDPTPLIRLEDNNSAVGSATALIEMYDNSSTVQMEMGLSTFGGLIRVNAPGEDLNFMTHDGSSVNTRMKISGTNGFVGIGQVGVPSGVLTIRPPINSGIKTLAHFYNDVNKRMFDFSATATNDAQLKINDNTVATQIELNAVGSSYFNGGNVGIGTSTPGAKLSVFDDNVSAGTILFDVKDNASKTVLYLNDNGFLGVNRTSPIGNSNFVVNDNDNNGFGGMYVNVDNANGKPFYGYSLNGTTSVYTYLDGTDANKLKWVNGSTRMTLDATGNLGIGTINPAAKLEVVGESRVSGPGGAFRVIDRVTLGFYYTLSSSSGNFDIQFGTGASNFRINGANTYIGEGFAGSGIRLTVGTSGDGSIAVANSWTTFSDRRFKENIQPISNALALVKSLNGVTYDWKKSGINDIGFIAQDVEEVLPIIVHTDEETGYKSMDYARVTPILIEAVKEQQKMIEELQKEIELLKKKQ